MGRAVLPLLQITNIPVFKYTRCGQWSQLNYIYIHKCLQHLVSEGNHWAYTDMMLKAW